MIHGWEPCTYTIYKYFEYISQQDYSIMVSPCLWEILLHLKSVKTEHIYGILIVYFYSCIVSLSLLKGKYILSWNHIHQAVLKQYMTRIISRCAHCLSEVPLLFKSEWYAVTVCGCVGTLRFSSLTFQLFNDAVMMMSYLWVETVWIHSEHKLSMDVFLTQLM